MATREAGIRHHGVENSPRCSLDCNLHHRYIPLSVSRVVHAQTRGDRRTEHQWGKIGEERWMEEKGWRKRDKMEGHSRRSFPLCRGRSYTLSGGYSPRKIDVHLPLYLKITPICDDKAAGTQGQFRPPEEHPRFRR